MRAAVLVRSDFTPRKSTRHMIRKRLTDQITVGQASPMLEFDAAAGQVLPQLHPPLRWQVLNGVLLSHVRINDPKGEKVGRRVGSRGVTAPSSGRSLLSGSTDEALARSCLTYYLCV